VNGLLHHYVLEEASEGVRIAVGFVHVLIWYFVTQMTVLVIAKNHAAPDDPQPQSTADGYTSMPLTSTGGDPSPAPTVSDPGAPLVPSGAPAAAVTHATTQPAHGGGGGHGGKMAEEAKSMGGLLAHITAFAAIHFFHDIHEMMESEFGGGGLSVFLCIAVFLLLFFAAARVRNIIIAWDGKKTADEEVWEEVVRETEDDAMALCTSSLIALTVQVAVEGPEPEHHHTGKQILTMVGAALFCMLVMTLLACKGHGEHAPSTPGGHAPPGGHAHHDKDDSALPKHRLLEIVQLTSSFTFAWCMLCSSTWGTMNLAHHLDWTHIWMEVVEAIGVSLACIGIIRLLDLVADSDATDARADKVIKDSVLAFGVLIGFTWEHPFDLGVEEIAAGFEGYEEIMQFVLCSLIAAIVLPAYKWYIVPIQFKMLDEKNAEDAAGGGH
jgi:hypothetical protein